MRLRNTQEEKVVGHCERLLPEVIEFTRAMVGKYAVLGHEHGILKLVEDWLTRLEMPVERVPMERARLAQHRLYAPVEWAHEDKYNLACSLASGLPGRRLVLNGHLDVVPAGQTDPWLRPPHVAWERDGWLYGRGAGDMQAGVAAMIYAARAVNVAGFRLLSPLTIQCVVEEECSGNGTLACLEHGVEGDFVLIPEPVGPTLYTAQVGVLWFKIAVQGRPVHALDTAAGSNAIEKLYALVPALKALEQSINAPSRAPPYDALEHPFNLNIGKIAGGNWPSTVPSYAEMECRIGYPPGVTAAEMMTRVRDAIGAVVDGDSPLGSELPRLTFHGFRSDGHCVDLSHPGTRLLGECHEDLTGKPIERSVNAGSTDLRYFHFHSGICGTCYGPVAENIHGVNERVSIDSVLQTLRAYALFLCRWCDTEPL
jgi:acetylornithine deacetylase